MKKAVAIIFLILAFLWAPYAKQYAMGQGITVMPDPVVEQRDNTIIIKQDYGGAMSTYMLRFLEMKKRNMRIAIDGECDSSCTLFMGYIPQQSICVTQNAKLGFHRSNRPEGTVVMLMNYPQPILMWLLAEGITEDIKYLPTEIMNAIFQECPHDLINPPEKPKGEKVD